jgi:sulfur relay protein TusB/DsrH
MTTLHLIHGALEGHEVVDRCLRATMSGDVILFYGNGVIAAATLDPNRVGTDRTLCVHTVDACDLHVAGRIDSRFERIDDARFVELVVACERSVAWD